MKILWISDYSIKHNKGGAQRSDDILIKKGKEIGHEIQEFHYDSELKVLEEKYDHVISSNLDAISRLFPAIVNWLGNLENHSRLEHDKNSYLTLEMRKLLFSKCQNTFFLTEYHHNLFLRMYGNIFRNVSIVSDPIDPDVFFDKKTRREDKILTVGFMHYLKGSPNFYEFALENPNKKFVVAGWGSPMYEHLAKTIPNVEFLGKLEHEKMPEIYNEYTDFFYHPNIEEPFCRSVGEAALCGMKLAIAEDRIGAAQEIRKGGLDNFRNSCKEASNIFWQRIGK